MRTGPPPERPVLRLRRLPHGEGLPLPAYQSAGAAGLDLPAAADVTLAPGERALVPTGFAIAVPHGYVGDVRPRSGLALRRGVTTLNSPGTIDADYRGEVRVLLVNLGESTVVLRRGDRIAQLVLVPVAAAAVREVAELDGTSRGEGGFGHTGLGARHGAAGRDVEGG
ncbi:MAG: dUTP diphosphatase [Firmicutes bacterium]|nr:dUTP diphosphatase [Bacillota bacterium]